MCTNTGNPGHTTCDVNPDGKWSQHRRHDGYIIMHGNTYTEQDLEKIFQDYIGCSSSEAIPANTTSDA